MRRTRLFSLLSLLVALPGCTIQPLGVLLVTPARQYAPAHATGTPLVSVVAYTLSGKADIFGQPFAGAHVSVYALGSDERLAQATVASDGSFVLSIPPGLSADMVLKVVASKDGQTLTSLHPLPSQLFKDDLLSGVLPKEELLLSVDSTVSYALLAPRIEAAGQVKDNGRTTHTAYDAFIRLTDSFSGLVTAASDPTLQQAVLSAQTPGLRDGVLAVLGNTASPAQHSAFIEAANQMAESLREALQSPDNPAVESSLLGSLKLGNSSVSPVFPSGSNHRPTPFNGSAGLTIGAPLPGGFSDPGAGPSVRDIPLVTTYSPFSLPKNLAIDSSGNVWVVNYGGGTVTRISATGSLSTFPAGTNPTDIAVDAAGNVWVANAGSHNVTRISSTGSLSTFAMGASSSPGSVKVDAAGNAWIANSAADNVIRIGTDGSTTTYPVGLQPVALALDGSGNTWVANNDDGTVTRISSTGSLSTFTVGGSPNAITVDAGGNAWVTADDANPVSRISPAGVITTFPVGGDPMAVAVDPAGNAWVANNSSDDVTRISSTGSISTYATGNGPWNVAVEADGTAWVAHGGTSSVTRISATGAVFNIAVPGGTWDVKLDAAGNAWVTHFASGKVSRLAY